MSGTEKERSLSRREFIKTTALMAALAVTTPQDTLPSRRSLPPLGATFLSGEVNYWGREPTEVLNGLLNMGIKTIRLPLYPQRVSDNDFEESKRYADLINNKGGKVVWVVGLKQPGWPEVYPTRQLKEDAPEIDEEGFVLDSSPTIVQVELEIAEKSAVFINEQKDVTWGVQGGNESTIWVEAANWRYYSASFYQEKIKMLKQSTGLPIMATYPDTPPTVADWDLWIKGLWNLKEVDYLGFNHYTQIRPLSIALETGYWALQHATYSLVRNLGPTPYVAEAQVVAPWYDTPNNPREFSTEKGLQDYQRLLSLNPARIDLWGIGPAASPRNPHLWRHLEEIVASAA